MRQQTHAAIEVATGSEIMHPSAESERLGQIVCRTLQQQLLGRESRTGNYVAANKPADCAVLRDVSIEGIYMCIPGLPERRWCTSRPV